MSLATDLVISAHGQACGVVGKACPVMPPSPAPSTVSGYDAVADRIFQLQELGQ
jgi:hypothetical protein